MYDLTKIYPVLNHLQNISPGMFESRGTHYMMFCQFCDDATRKQNPEHGHLYVSKDLPVFYCQRCGAAGTILKLLIYTGFEDEECLNYISSFLKYKFVKDYYNVKKLKKSKSKKTDIEKRIIQNIREIKKTNIDDYNRFLNYTYNRIGNSNFLYFLISPGYIKIRTKQNAELVFFSCWFNNHDGYFSTARIIDQNQYFRFKNSGQNHIYYFQEMNFEKYDTITLTEGPFDIINTYIYNSNFQNQNTFFASVNGKKFISNIEKFVIQELLLGNYEINIIFDNDDWSHETTLKKARFLVNNLNPDIVVRGWLPSFDLPKVKDVSDFPSLTEV